MREIVISAFLVTAAFACNGVDQYASGETGPTVTDSPYPQVGLEDGSAIEVEVVATPEARARGLMYRRYLPERHGMLFLFPRVEVQSFWMKNTLIPLDIIWIDEDLEVIEIITAPPCEGDPCPSYWAEEPAAFVLEIGAGEAERLGIEVGSKLELRNIEETTGS